MIRRIHHTAISTPNLGRLLAFYRDLLGFEVTKNMDWPKGSQRPDEILRLTDTAARAAMLRCGDSMIELFEFSSPTPKPQDPERPVVDHGITHICFLVDDLQAVYARLEAAGTDFHCPPQDDGSGVAVTYGRDPDGNVIELMQVYDSAHEFHVAD